ncbi:MAG: dual specificity protein phosphatase family protein [Myxococcota bacterium]
MFVLKLIFALASILQVCSVYALNMPIISKESPDISSEFYFVQPEDILPGCVPSKAYTDNYVGTVQTMKHDAPRTPTVTQKTYYSVISTLNNWRAHDWMPGPLHFNSFNTIPLPPGVWANGCSFQLGMQPEDWLAKRINASAAEKKQEVFVVSVLEPFEAVHTSRKLKNIHRVDSQDNRPMSPDEIDVGVKLLERAVAKGNQYVYVHCKSGAGRSATVIAAFLVKHAGMTPEAAGQYLYSMRKETVLARIPEHYHLTALKSWAVNQ